MSQRDQAKAATHERIVASASRLIRQKGLAAASVKRVMQGAGLTVGSFYAHFPSKNAMLAEVLQKLQTDTRNNVMADLENDTEIGWLTAFLNRYLSPEHRDGPEPGYTDFRCPWPSILSELSHVDEATRSVILEGVEIYLQQLAAHAPQAFGVTPRERALATFTLCLGGIALARGFRGHPISDEVVNACIKWSMPETWMRPTSP